MTNVEEPWSADETAPTLAALPAAQDADPGSVLARLRAQREGEQADETRDLVVPGWGRGLQVVARYGKTPYAQTRGLTRRVVQQGGMMDLATACDLLILALRDLLVRDLDAGPDAPLQQITDGEELRYGARMLEVLGRPARPTVREAVLSVYNGEQAAIVAHASQLLNWYAGADEEDLGRALEDRLGES